MLSYLVLLFATVSANAQSRIYVSPQGGGDGSAWTSAMTLAEALAKAQPGDEIWLRGYEQITDKAQLYIAPADGWKLPSGVKMYGGFEGTETSIDQRKNMGKTYQLTFRSVLSGDIGVNDEASSTSFIFPENTTRADNAKHVLVLELDNTNGNDNSYPTVVDGFTIAGGHAADAGGGIYVNGGNNCVPFSINSCFLVNNYAPIGGAVYVAENVSRLATQSVINQCVIYNNVAGTIIGKDNDGGGAYVAGAGNIVNCSIFNNENGGVVLSANAYLVNSTVARNTGGGVDMASGASVSSPNVWNSVIWGNSFVFGKYEPLFSYSAYPDAPDSNGNINLSKNNRGDETSPMFDAPSLKTSFDADYDLSRNAYPFWSWRLMEGSYLIDKGSNEGYELYGGLIDTDIAGSRRIVGTIDINAYEFQAVPAARIRYVRKDGSDSNDGTTWEKAYKSVQKAINALAANPEMPGEVWVAAGTYEPTELIDGSGSPASFRMYDGISVYGGFAGTESSKEERAKGAMPWQFENETILRGNTFNGENTWNETDNKWTLSSASTHVLWFAPLPGDAEFNKTTVVEGVTIEGGQAKLVDALNFSGDRGAGVYMQGANVYLVNSVVANNVAQSVGGGIYMKGGRVQGCLVFNNSSDSDGGGIYVDNAGLVLRSMITNNSALNGGGVYLANKELQDDGKNHPEYQILSTSVITNNTSVQNGAVYCDNGGIILQSTIANNYTPTTTDNASGKASQTGGLYIDTYTLVVNSVFWNNYINDRKVQLYAANPSTENVQIHYSAVANMNNIVWNNTLQDGLIQLAETNQNNSDGGLLDPGFEAGGLPAQTGVRGDVKDITYFWQPITGANLRARGMSLGMLPGAVLVAPELDITGSLFDQKPSLGAYRVEKTQIVPEDGGTYLRVYVDVECTEPTHDGSSWDKAYRSLNEAIDYMSQLQPREVGNKELQIFVVEGDGWPRYASVNLDPKSATIDVPAMASGKKLTVKAGFSRENHGTWAPLIYRTQINGNHEGKDIKDGLYHCITVEKDAVVEFDGLHIINGYAASTANLKYGAGMLVRDGANVTVKNTIFENNTAAEGAAIDARGATLTMVNCVVNNNSNITNTASVINCPNLTMHHVTVVNNVGAAPAAMGTSSFAAGNTSGNTFNYASVGAEGYKNFANPTNKQGATLGFDTYLGGYSNFAPLTSSADAGNLINKASGTPSGLVTDIAGNERSLGGAPDLGAYEADLPKTGRVYYVKENGNDSNDGLSWDSPLRTIRKAVNLAAAGEVVKGEKPQVWVAAGSYAQAPLTGSDNCFDILEGVNVYGSFPKEGTPGMNERHPFISDIIYHDPMYSPEDYETILKPSGTSDVRRVLGQADEYNPKDDEWQGRVRYVFAGEGYGDYNWQNNTYTYVGAGKGDYIKTTDNYFALKTTWDGFTIRDGYINSRNIDYLDDTGRRNGGAGVAIFTNVTVTNCIIYNNTNDYKYYSGGIRGGGVYCDQGSLVNCYIIKNVLGDSNDNEAYGGGCYMYRGTAYNCVISQNETIGNYTDGAGIFIENAQFFNNTIVKNTSNGKVRGNGGVSIFNSGSSSKLVVYNCIVMGNEGFKGLGGRGNADIAIANEGIIECHNSILGENINNVYQSSGEIQISYNDCSVQNNTIFENYDEDNYRLNGTAGINTGNDMPIINGETIDLSVYTDMDFTDRIKDCTVDAGAYEANVEENVAFEQSTDGSEYTYYVTQNGSGLRNGSSLEDAACAMKLQTVLNHAGQTVQQNINKKVVVKLAGYEDDMFVYRANTLLDENDPQSYTFNIPYGVVVEGGYDGMANDWSDTNRNPKKYRTILSAISERMGQTVNGYHTVTFGERPVGWSGEDKKTIIDGLYLIDGKATSMAGTGNPNTRGGGAIVPAWAHVRNCVIAQCEAIEGGGLYLLPGATVSGCLIMSNKAENGGGIYADNENCSEDLRAHLISNTISDNEASSMGGGIYFEDGAVLTTNSVIWGNTAPSDKNVSGVVGEKLVDTDFTNVLGEGVISEFYPFNHCYVETYELPSNYENTSMTSNEELYFRADRTLKAYSELIKHGTPNYQGLKNVFDIADKDMQGIERKQTISDRMDVGAYAFDGGMIPLPDQGAEVIKRIFVRQGTDLATVDNIDNYIGRSFYTPVSWLDDALEYIKNVRKVNGLENTGFEIYVAEGVYKPSIRRTDAASKEIDQRQNSFVIPKGVKIFGGFKGDEPYSYGSIDNIDGVTLIDIKDNEENRNALINSRTYSDLNNNGVFEPWELANQTILSGDINVSPTVKNAYHVVFSSDTNDGTVGSVLLDGLTIKDGETWHELSSKIDEVGRGGAIYTYGVDYTLKGCRIINCRGVRGGAIYARDANLTIIGSSITGNGTMDDAAVAAGMDIRGGAVYMAGYRKSIFLKAVNTLWGNNETIGKGGAIATSNDLEYSVPVSVSLMNNTMVRNKAAEASAIYSTSGVDVANTVIWGGEETGDTKGAVLSGITISNSACESVLEGENNIKLNASNMAIDGPRFKQPTVVAGLAGHDIASKWNPASISVLTDAGDGELEYGNPDMTQATGAYKEWWALSGIADCPETFYMGSGGYNRYMGQIPVFGGEPEPKIIDIGLYEYQYESRFLLMDEIFVDTQEHGDGGGNSWANATSDLRGAIVALSDPEGGDKTDKTIYIRGGEYPQAQLYISGAVGKGIAYQVKLNGATGDENKITSLTIKGSYGENGVQDFSKPTVFLPSSAAPDVETMFYAQTNGKTLNIEGITFSGASTGFLADNNTGETSGEGKIVLKNVAFRNNKEKDADIENLDDVLVANTLFADGNIGLHVGSSNNKVKVLNATFANHTGLAISGTGTPEVYNTVDWKSAGGIETNETNCNVNLGTAQNDDIINGPNFVDPDNGNYMIRPGLKLLNKASKDKYNEILGVAAVLNDKDLASNRRLTDDALDIGAYEYNAPLQQIIYVKSNVAQTDGSGASWENPIKNLLEAVDLASVYVANNKDNDAYVFVHKDVKGVQNVNITSAGVKVYGGMNDETGADADALLRARSGVLDGSMSEIENLSISGNSVVDGFRVSGVVNVEKGMLSTSVIEGNANVESDGFIYNSFVRGTLSGTGKAVNVTSPNSVNLPVVNKINVVENAVGNGYVIGKDIWGYQLKEDDEAIDSGGNIDEYITMAGHSKDLSGAIRIRKNVDNGCFETWNIDADVTLDVTDMPTENHVVYVRKGVEANIAAGLYPEGRSFNVGFLLLEHGAGLRSNGNNISLKNFAVERWLDESNDYWDMSYMPFDITHVEGSEDVDVKTYDGAARAAYDYVFNATDGAWKDVSIQGKIGMMMQSEKDSKVRMYGNSYLESPNQSGAVHLLRYNNIEPWDGTTSSSQKFTHMENMSWNMFGSPFLCAMNYDDMEYGRVIYKKNSKTYSTVNTANQVGSMEAGSAVFTQTATLKAEEVFAVRQRTDGIAADEPLNQSFVLEIAKSGNETEDIMSLTTTYSDEAVEEFNMAVDGVKVMTVSGDAAQIYIERAGKRYSMLSAVDIEGIVSVGVTVKDIGTYVIKIPEYCKESDYETVILTDKFSGKTVDLLETEYEFAVSDQNEISGRFIIQFNKKIDNGNNIFVYSDENGNIVIEGGADGMLARLYDVSGRMLAVKEIHSTVERFVELEHGIYVVQIKIGDSGYKVFKVNTRN